MCQILLVISSVPSFKLIEETCERTFSMHFDYCTTANIDFVMLDESTFRNILQVILALLFNTKFPAEKIKPSVF